MGDPSRHRVLSDFVEDNWSDRTIRIADVAGGHGRLNAELYRRSYRNVVTIDKRQKRWTNRPHFRYGLFSVDDAPEFDLLLAMHPDEATDVVLAAAIKYDIPCVVVPCCSKPTVWEYDISTPWLDHLVSMTGIDPITLPMSGANSAIVRR